VPTFTLNVATSKAKNADMKDKAGSVEMNWMVNGTWVGSSTFFQGKMKTGETFSKDIFTGARGCSAP